MIPRVLTPLGYPSFLVTMLLLQVAWLPTSTALAAEKERPRTACYLVEVASGASVDEVAAHAAETTGGLVVRKFTKLAHGFAICLPADTDPAALMTDPGVLRVDADPGVSLPQGADVRIE